MKNALLFCTLVCIEIFFGNISVAQTNTFPPSGAAGIGTVTPNASSILEVKSTTKGVLVPRMTKTQRDAIVSPVQGLLIYQTNSTPGIYYYEGAWTAVGGKSANKSLSNLTAPTAVNVNLLPGTNNTVDLGSSSLGWKDVYANGSYYLGGNKVLSIKGTENTFVGISAGNSNTSGNDNIATGAYALYSNTTGSYNIANGDSSLYFNTTGGNNTATGRRTLYSNTTGSFNVATGSFALYSNTTGISNTANGADALYSNTTAVNNTANGYYALYYTTTGGYNTATGQIALFTNTTGDYNTAIGAGALYSNTTGRLNAATGGEALYSNTTGFNNTATGEGALYGNITGSYNCAFGQSASFTNSALSNTSCMGYNSGGAVNASNRIELGNTSVSVIAGQVGFSSYSDERIKDNIKEDVPGLAFISKLHPVTYNLNIHKENAMIYKGIKKDEPDWEGKYDIEKIKMTGFLAQDVEKAAEETGYDFSGVQKPANPDELYSLRYSDFVMPLVKAVQELDSENGKLKMDLSRFSRENGEQQKQIDELKVIVAELQSGRQSSVTDSFAKLKTLNSKPETILGQNIPNPFDNSTLIPFRIPKDCHDASIMISNSSTSEVISVIPISCNEDHASIAAGVLASGTYSYSLYIDGTLMQTKQMAIVR